MGKVVKMISDKVAEQKHNINALKALVDKTKLPLEHKKELIKKIKNDQQ